MIERIPTNRIKFFIHFIKKQKFSFTFLILFASTAASLNSIWPFITGNLIDTINEYSKPKSEFFDHLGLFMLATFAFWIVLEIFNRLQGFALAYIFPNFEKNIRMESFKYANQHSQAYFANNYVGGIANRISDMPRSASMVVDCIINDFLPFFVGMIVTVSLFTTLDPTLSGILLGWLAIHFAICFIAAFKASELSKNHSEARTSLLGRIVDTLANHLNVKLYSKIDFEIQNISGAQKEEMECYKRTLVFIETIKIILSVLALISIAIIGYVTISFWQKDIITLGTIIFVFNSVINILSLAYSATIEMSYLFRELGVIKQALRIIKDPIDITDSPNATDLEVNDGNIEFKKVTFNYRRNDNVFKEKSLTIKGGQKVGLVGFSGSGKTTFAHLILRLYDISSGKIMIDGTNISDVKLESLRDNISFIPQEPVMFHRTIKENIKYSRPDASDEQIIEAAKKANCHEFIMEMENAYDTVIGERGGKISGGQKQRISLARAILQEAPILILDEATSALDSYTEKQIQDSIRYLSKDKTTIIIAHRLSTLLEVDRILVFDKGTIVEDGNHKELLEKGGHYSTLWSMQVSGLIPESLDKL